MLHEIQRRFRAAMLADQQGGLEDVIISGGVAAADRVRIHRNTSRSVLTDCLQLNFPVLDRLVGRDFFDMAAARFMRAHPPACGYLNDYGAGFPFFLQAMPETAGLAYLSDVGRFEWALGRAANAPDIASLDLSTLAAIDPMLHDAIALSPHPSVSLLRLAFPADAIADAVIGGDPEAMREIDLAAGPILLVVDRSDAGIQAERLQRDAYEFLQALFDGRPLGGLRDWPGVDVARCLADQFAKMRIVGFSVREMTATSGSLA